MIERSEVTKIQRWLRATFPGCYLIKLESPSTAGILDMYFAYRGTTAWLEIKKQGYRNRTWKNKKIQEWHIKELNRNGVYAGFFFSLDDVKSFFESITSYSEYDGEINFKPMKLDYDHFRSGLKVHDKFIKDIGGY